MASGINNSVTSIPLGSGQGALFPQPYRGTASSTGDETTLNDTGDLGSVAQYKIIRNVTDGSWAIVLTTGANSITTTRLRNGSDNIWQSGDEWRVDEFVVYFDDGDVNGENITKREKALVINRSSDTLTVATGGRGYDGSSAQSFLTGNYVRLNVASKSIEEIIKALADFGIAENTLNTNLDAAEAAIDSIESGETNAATATGSSNAYAITVTPVPLAYADKQLFRFKANFSNTGSATLNVNTLGAKTIKKSDGATNLASGDIENGQIVVVQYDGTNFQMLSPIANQSTIVQEDVDVIYSNTDGYTVGAANDDSVQSTSSLTAFTKTFTCPANFFLSEGDRIQILAYGKTRSKASGAGTMTLQVQIGGQNIVAFAPTMTDNVDNQAWRIEADAVCKTPGASGKLFAIGRMRYEGASTKDYFSSTYDNRGSLAEVSVDTTTTNVIRVTVTFSVSDVANYCDLAYLGIVKLRDIN